MKNDSTFKCGKINLNLNFRCEFGLGDTIKRAKQLSSFAAYLHRLSNKYSVPVVCVNQVLIITYSPTGSVYGFGMKRRQQRRMPASSKSASNLKILHIVKKAGLFHILFGLIKF